MSLLRSLFGPSKREVWQALAKTVEGEFVPGGFFGKDLVQTAVGDWMITLDTYEEQHGQSSTTYTRLRAPYVNPEGFRFQIYRSSVFSDLGRALGMEDIHVGDPVFDDDFVVKANSASRVRWLLDSDEIRDLIAAQPRLHLEVKNDEGWFGASFPNGVDELYFRARGTLKHLGRLEDLFTLFAEVLHRLCHQSPAYEDDVDLHVQRLRAPGGRIETNRVMLWEGDSARRDAAEALGALGDPKAVPALATVLYDSDEIVRARAIDALMDIAHEKAIRPLIPLLGDAQIADGRPIRDRVADSLRNLGEGDVVDVVLGALRGEYERARRYEGPYRRQVATAFEEALSGPTAIHAAKALQAMLAVESLPALRKAMAQTGRRSPSGQAISDAIQALEQRSALPRPAEAAPEATDTLPRVADEPQASSDTLPKSVERE